MVNCCKYLAPLQKYNSVIAVASALHTGQERVNLPIANIHRPIVLVPKYRGTAVSSFRASKRDTTSNKIYKIIKKLSNRNMKIQYCKYETKIRHFQIVNIKRSFFYVQQSSATNIVVSFRIKNSRTSIPVLGGHSSLF